MSKGKLILTIAAVVILFFFLWQYVFTVYEVKSEVNRFKLSGNSEKVEINVFPVNAFGKKAPLREIGAEFIVIQGDSLINPADSIHQKNKLTFNTAGNSGTIIVKIITDLSLFPIIEEIKVLPE